MSFNINANLLGKITFDSTLEDAAPSQILSNPLQANSTAGSEYIEGNPVDFNTTDQLYGTGCVSFTNNVTSTPFLTSTWLKYSLNGALLGNQFTISFCFNVTDANIASQDDEYMFNLSNNDNSQVFTLSTSNNGSIYINSSWGGWQQLGTYTLMQWNHITLDIDITNDIYIIYHNNVAYPMGVGVPLNFWQNVRNVMFGARPTDNNIRFCGLIDDFRIFNYALSANQTTALYNAYFAPTPTVVPYTFFIDEEIIINQNTIINAQIINANESNYEYVLDINANMNNLFNSRTYIQNAANQQNIDLNISTNIDYMNSLLAGNVAIYSANESILNFISVYNGLPKGPESVGQKLLEIVATKIFGNSNSIAGISNQLSFTSIDTNPNNNTVGYRINTGINNALVNLGNILFDQYIASDKYSNDIIARTNNDTTTPYDFNFLSSVIDIPLRLTGELDINSNNGILNFAQAAYASAIMNGPDVGGSSLVNGAYNITFLIKFHD